MLTRNCGLLSCSLMWIPIYAQAKVWDLYPEIRTLILEAEAAYDGKTELPSRRSAMAWASDLYGRAGYFADAARAAKKAGVPPGWLVFARVLYGDLNGGLKEVRSIRDSVSRASMLTHLGGELWRMGDRTNAGDVLDEAERAARTILNPSKRRLHLQLIAQQRQALPNEPPSPISPIPHPRARHDVTSDIPAFPITVDGFRDESPENIARTARENKVYLMQLYALIASRDRPGLVKHTAAASSPFQKTLGLASIEHLLIQVGRIQEAEETVQSIPDDGAACSLAKTEALTAVATAWARKGDTNHARQSFSSALKNVDSVRRELAFGKAVVVASIAAGQAESGFVATSAGTLDFALTLVSQVEPRPKRVNGVYPKTYGGHRFRDDAFGAVFGSAIRMRDLGAARHTVELWRTSEGDSANFSIVHAWVDAGRKPEALVYVRGLEIAMERVEALLMLAGILLDEAGASSP